MRGRAANEAFLTRLENREIYYLNIQPPGLSLEQLDILSGHFTCGVILDEHCDIDWQDFHRTLIAAGCRGIAICGPNSEIQEDIFDRLCVQQFRSNDTPITIWSTSHTDLEEMLRIVTTLDVDGTYAQEGTNAVHIMQVGEIDCRLRCSEILKQLRV